MKDITENITALHEEIDKINWMTKGKIDKVEVGINGWATSITGDNVDVIVKMLKQKRANSIYELRCIVNNIE